MQVKEILDDIEQAYSTNGQQPPDRLTLLRWISSELSIITSKVPADCFYIYLNPIVSTVAGTKNYPLPNNFPMNFVKNAGTVGDKYCCMLDDGTNESALEYKSPAQFYSQDLRAIQNSIPSSYTIMNLPSGRKELVLSPTPDDNYSVNGLYSPTDWSLTAENQIPSFPENNPVLLYGVLRRPLPKQYEALYRDSLKDLIYTIASSRGTRMVPKIKG